MNRHVLIFLLGSIISVILFSCASPKVTPFSFKTIAVWELSDYSASDQTMTDMGEIFTSKLIQTIQKKPDVKVVEREKLDLALSELHIGSAAVADESTRLEIGKILGASHMIFGGYQVFAGMMRVDLRLVEVETGKIITASQNTVTGTGMSQWIEAVEDAGDKLFQ